jgi:hypothetical protein
MKFFIQNELIFCQCSSFFSLAKYKTQEMDSLTLKFGGFSVFRRDDDDD